MTPKMSETGGFRAELGSAAGMRGKIHGDNISGLMYWAVCIFLCCCPALHAYGQSSTQGAIVGSVVDPSDSALPNVTLSLLNTETGIKRSGVSNREGYYRIDFLQPGSYQITAESRGFKKILIDNINVQVGQVVRVDIHMVVGEINEELTIAPETPTINTESATQATVIDNEKILKLPLNGREFLALAALVPGAESGNPKRGAVYSKGLSIGFNGARAGYNSYYLDGAASTSPNRNELISSPALEAIKEFRVETNLYSAQYGRSGGAVINVVTASGTNALHGTVYEFHRNKALDARPHFYTGSRENQPPYLFNQFGVAVGGPIVRDKTFFFGSYEGFRQKLPGQVITSFAPTAKERAGDYSESINPWTLQPVVLKNPFTGEPIPGNKLPASLINPVGQRLMDLWPEPNFTGDPFLNLRYFRSGSFDQNKYLAKINHSFSARDTLSATFNFGDYDNTTVGNTVYGDISDLARDRTLVVTYTHVFSPSVVNDLKGSFTHFRSGGDFVLNDKNYAKEWGLWSGTNADINGSPRLVMYTSGFQTFTLGNAGPFKYLNRSIYFKDNLVWTGRKHTLFIGGEFIRQPYDWEFNNIPATYTIGLLDGDPSSEDVWGVSGSTFANLLMGLSALTYHNVGDGQPMKLRRNAFGLYLQDDWKVTPRLTLNFGLRYDYEAPFSSANNQFVTLNFETGRPWYAAGVPEELIAPLRFDYDTGGPNRPFEPSKKNFSPRFGLAFRPFNDNKTVIRGGYGIFYTSETAWSTVFGSWVNPFAGEFRYFSRGAFWADGKDRFVPFDQEPLDFRFAASGDSGLTYTTTPYFPTGYLQQYNLSIGREIGGGVALEAAYVGSKGTNLDGILSLSGYSPEAYEKAIANGLNPGLRAKGHNSKYNSLQLKATKRFSHGLHFLAAFTWGHALAESSNSDVNENTLYDLAGTASPVQRRYSNADFDIRKRFSLSGGYQLPFGHKRAFGNNWNSFVNGVLGGWSINYILTLQDGYPFTVFDPAQRFPNRICDGNLPAGERTADRWFDFSCFPTKEPTTVTRPDGSTLTVLNGNSAPNVITGPGITNLDLGIHKEITITEGKRLEIRFEAFNAFNHPNLIGPALNIFFATESGAKITRVREMRDIQIALKFHF